MTDDRPPLLLPRGLLMLAALWLIGSWIFAMGVHPPVQPSSASFTPGVRLMVLCVMIGLMIGWPLMRVSQRPAAYPRRQTLLDIATLLALVQVVLWPLRIVTNWPLLRTGAIDATITGWLLLAGAVVASAIGARRSGPRNLAMLTCLAMCLLGPILAWVGLMAGADSMPLVNLSPLLAVHTLGEGGGTPPTPEQWRWIGLLFFAALAAWGALAATAAGRGDEPTSA